MDGKNAILSNTLTAPGERELVLTRVFDAPRERVFEAWTDPVQMARWWGPEHFTNPVCEIDVRPGGAIRIDMRGPDGSVYPMGGVFHEIVPPERLVFTSTAFHGKDGSAGLEVHNTVTFADQNGKTKLTIKAVIVKAKPETAGAIGGMEAGWSGSLVKLGRLVSGTSDTADREIVACRLFDAPRELVFQMWTDPQHIAQWWGPKGFTNTIHEMSVKPGGFWRFVMHGPDGTDYQNRIVYDEVVAPERIVYTHVSTPPFQSTATFAEEGGRQG